MFGCSPVRARKLRCALLLFVSLMFSIDAAADSGHYRVREETLATGVRQVQQFDTVTFPLLAGARPLSSAADPDAPGVDGARLRAVRALLPRKGNAEVALALPNESAYIKVKFYNNAVVVGYGGPSVTETSAPFWRTERPLIWEGGEKRQTAGAFGSVFRAVGPLFARSSP